MTAPAVAAVPATASRDTAASDTELTGPRGGALEALARTAVRGGVQAADDVARAPRVGCDLQRVAPVEQALAQRGERYLRAVFSREEIADLTRSGAQAAPAESVAGRFAAKEAVLKVLRPGRQDPVPWPHIEIRSDAHGAPHVRLHGAAADLAREAGLHHWRVSTSHDGGFAMAVALAADSEL